jgi:hypothetical protein
MKLENLARFTIDSDIVYKSLDDLENEALDSFVKVLNWEELTQDKQDEEKNAWYNQCLRDAYIFDETGIYDYTAWLDYMHDEITLKEALKRSNDSVNA